MISSILGILGGALTTVGNWILGYSSKKNTEARVINEEKSKEDSFNEALSKKDVSAIRRDLS